MVGARGDDANGLAALAVLNEAGVDLRHVRVTAQSTGVALILVGASTGDNMIAVVAGANRSLSGADARSAVSRMDEDDTLVLQLDLPLAAVEAALRSARECGVRTILNVAPAAGEAARLAKLADIVVANETEFALIAGVSAFDRGQLDERMTCFQKETGRILVVTLGPDGAKAVRHDGIIHVAGLNIEPVDTVGAGDTFCGYLAAGLDCGLAFDIALKRAAIAGSLACLQSGAQPAIPAESAVDLHMPGKTRCPVLRPT